MIVPDIQTDAYFLSGEGVIGPGQRLTERYERGNSFSARMAQGFRAEARRQLEAVGRLPLVLRVDADLEGREGGLGPVGTGRLGGVAVAVDGRLPAAERLEGAHLLVAHGERFDRTIYAIGAGAAMTEAFQNAVKNDYKGLGAWTVTPSSDGSQLSTRLTM